MKNILLLLFALIISCNSKSQEKILDLSNKNIYFQELDKETGWKRVKLNYPNKWGFVDQNDEVKIPFEYDFLNPFENQLAYAKKGNKEFFVNINNIKLEGEFDEARIFSFGLAAVKKNKKWGFIDEQGKLVIPMIYDEVDYFTQNKLSAVVKNGKSGFIDKTGKEVVLIIYEDARSEQMDNIVIVKKNKWAFFNNQGKQLSDFIYDEVFDTDYYDFSKDNFGISENTFFKNGAVLIRKGKVFEFLNEKLEPAFPSNKFDSASVFDTYHNAIVKSNGKYGMIRSNGEFKVPLAYDFIEPYDSNHGNYSEYYNARKGKIYSIFNKDLKKIGESYEPVYNDFSIKNPFIIFKNLQNKYGRVDSNGLIMIPFEYDEILNFNGENFSIAKKNNQFGIIDISNRILIPFKYKSISQLDLDDQNLFIISTTRNDKLVDLKGKEIISGYESIEPIFTEATKFIVGKNKKFGIIDINKNVILPLEYDEISNWTEYGPEHSKFIVKNGKTGLIDDKTFKITIPPIYDKFLFINGLIFAKEGTKAGIITEQGKVSCDFIYDEIYINRGDFYSYGNKEPRIYAKKGNAYFQIDAKGKILKSNLTKKFVVDNSAIL